MLCRIYNPLLLLASPSLSHPFLLHVFLLVITFEHPLQLGGNWERKWGILFEFPRPNKTYTRISGSKMGVCLAHLIFLRSLPSSETMMKNVMSKMGDSWISDLLATHKEGEVCILRHKLTKSIFWKF